MFTVNTNKNVLEQIILYQRVVLDRYHCAFHKYPDLSLHYTNYKPSSTYHYSLLLLSTIFITQHSVGDRSTYIAIANGNCADRPEIVIIITKYSRVNQ